MTLRRIGRGASLDARGQPGQLGRTGHLEQLQVLYAAWVQASDVHAGRVRRAQTGVDPATVAELQALQREARSAWHVYQEGLVRASLERDGRHPNVAPGSHEPPRAVVS